jgi:hypothetical protein
MLHVSIMYRSGMLDHSSTDVTFTTCVSGQEILIISVSEKRHIDKYRCSETVMQVCTNPGPQLAQATKFCTMAPNICGSSIWNLLHVTLLASRILR